MTRDERIVEAYRGGALTMREIAKLWAISHARVGQILKDAGIESVRSTGRPRGPIPDHMRKSYVGGAEMTAAQLADAVRSRLERTRGAELIYVLIDRGRVYAPINRGAVEEFATERPELLVGCYAKGFEVGDLAEDIEAARSAV